MSLGLKMAYFSTFKPELEKTIVMLEISILELVKNFMLTKKKLNLEPKLSSVGTFGMEFEKTIVLLQSAYSKLSKCKVSCKRRNLSVLD